MPLLLLLHHETTTADMFQPLQVFIRASKHTEYGPTKGYQEVFVHTWKKWTEMPGRTKHIAI